MNLEVKLGESCNSRTGFDGQSGRERERETDRQIREENRERRKKSHLSETREFNKESKWRIHSQEEEEKE